MPFDFFRKVSLAGKIGIITTWYFDGDVDGLRSDLRMCREILRYIPRMLNGNYDCLPHHVAFWLYDALASFPARDEELEWVCRRCEERMRAAAREDAE